MLLFSLYLYGCIFAGCYCVPFSIAFVGVRLWVFTAHEKSLKLCLQLAFYLFMMQGMKNNNNNKMILGSAYPNFDEENLPDGCGIADCKPGEYGNVIVTGYDSKDGSYGFNCENGDSIYNPDFWVVGGIYTS